VVFSRHFSNRHVCCAFGRDFQRDRRGSLGWSAFLWWGLGGLSGQHPAGTGKYSQCGQRGVLAGTPTKLTITALRREPIEVRTPGTEVAAPEVLSETVLAPVGSVAGTAPQGADAVAVSVEDALKEVEVEAPKVEEAKPVVAAPAADRPSKPYIQVGTFSSEANAKALVVKLKSAEVPADVTASQTSNGKTLYKVLAGPAASAEQLTLFSSKISGLGFRDAFTVSK